MAVLTKEERCEGRVFDQRGWSTHQCSQRHQPGRPFCKTHDPEIIAAKQKARDAKWKAEWDARAEGIRKQAEADKITAHKAACFDELLAALKWASGHISRYSARIPNQNERYCDGYDAMIAAIEKAEKMP